MDDNFYNSKAETIDNIKKITNKELTFYKTDVSDEEAMETIFKSHKVDGIIHFTGLKAVGESVEKPIEYYYNNLVRTLVLTKLCKKYNVNKFVFSSYVMDLAKGHVAALNKLQLGVNIYNLGTGEGTSVLQLIKAFEEANSIKIPYEIAPRRQGDIASCYADVSKAERELGWKAKFDIIKMCRDAWRFEFNFCGSGRYGIYKYYK